MAFHLGNAGVVGNWSDGRLDCAEMFLLIQAQYSITPFFLILIYQFTLSGFCRGVPWSMMG